MGLSVVYDCGISWSYSLKNSDEILNKLSTSLAKKNEHYSFFPIDYVLKLFTGKRFCKIFLASSLSIYDLSLHPC